MKKNRTKINYMTGLYDEWRGCETITVDENFHDLLMRIRMNQINGTTIISVKAVDSPTKAININYITDIWIDEV